MNLEKVFLKIFGFWLIFLGLLAISFAIYSGRFGDAFWFCYIAMLLIGIGMILEEGDLIVIQLNIFAIALVVWNIDFYYLLLTGRDLFGITSYTFTQRGLIATFISLQHIYTIFISLISLYIIKFSKKNLWKISFMEMTLLFIFGVLLSPSELNVNCVHKNCLPFDTVIPYWLFWFIVIFLVVLITNKAIERIKIFRKN